MKQQDAFRKIRTICQGLNEVVESSVKSGTS